MKTLEEMSEEEFNKIVIKIIDEIFDIAREKISIFKEEERICVFNLICQAICANQIVYIIKNTNKTQLQVLTTFIDVIDNMVTKTLPKI